MSTPARTIDLLQPAGLLADRPDPAAVPAGSLYPALDTQIIYRNNDTGTGWDEWLVIGDFSSYVSAEEVRDIVAAQLVAGTGVTLTNNDGADTLTIDATTDPEVVRDAIGAALVAGTGVTVTVDDTANTITISASSAGLDAEGVRDTIGATLVAGANVTITVDDAGNTITIAGAAGGLDAEGVRDAIGTALVGAGGVTVTPDDSGDTITVRGNMLLLAAGAAVPGGTPSGTVILRKA